MVKCVQKPHRFWLSQPRFHGLLVFYFSATKIYSFWTLVTSTSRKDYKLSSVTLANFSADGNRRERGIYLYYFLRENNCCQCVWC